MENALVSAVVAMGKNRVIGRKGELMWPIPDDLKRFRDLTTSHAVIMGRKTFDSIIGFRGKPLPNRTNIVITRDANWQYEDVIVAHSLEDALEKAREIETKEIFVIGGAQIYEQSLPHLDKIYLTLIDLEEEGDAYFPPFEHLFTKTIKEESREQNGIHYKWIDLER